MENQIGEKGDIFITRDGCNPELGRHGLVEMPKMGDNSQEYIDQSGTHKIDTQINIYPLGINLVEGIENTKQMAQLWNWKNDTHEFNWRNKPVALRIGYDKKKEVLRVHIWNSLGQYWINLKLTPTEIDRIVRGVPLVQ